MNKKGLTLVEVVVSLALLSVILLFLYNLLADLNEVTLNPTYDSINKSERFEVIKAVHEDFLASDLSSIAHSKTNTSIEVNFSYNEGKTSKLTLTQKADKFNHEIKYINKDNVNTKWNFKNVEIDYSGFKICKHLLDDNDFYAIKIIINIYTSNDLNLKHDNNLVDDLVFNYTGFNNAGFNNIQVCE